MYLSIRDETLVAAGYSSIAEGLRMLELKAVELFIRRDNTVMALVPAPDKERFDLTDPSDMSLLQSQAADHNIEICALCMGNNFNSEDREGEIERAVKALWAASLLKAEVLRIDPIMSGEDRLPLTERQQIVAAALQDILARTADSSVQIGIENHGVQGNDPDFLIGLLNLTDSDRAGLTLDSGNFYWRGWPLSKVYEIFEQFAPITKHTHIKNIGYPAEIRESHREIGFEYGTYACPIHEGDIDMARYIGILHKAGYGNDLCLEDESLGRYPVEQRHKNLYDACKFLQDILQGE